MWPALTRSDFGAGFVAGVHSLFTRGAADFVVATRFFATAGFFGAGRAIAIGALVSSVLGPALGENAARVRSMPIATTRIASEAPITLSTRGRQRLVSHAKRARTPIPCGSMPTRVLPRSSSHGTSTWKSGSEAFARLRLMHGFAATHVPRKPTAFRRSRPLLASPDGDS